MRTALLTLSTAALLAACTVGPDYKRPDVASAPAFKEAPAPDAGWLPAAPADTLDRGPWWQLFGDATLSGLLEQVEVSNQNVAAAVAAYAQAQAVVREQRASLFPTVGVSAGATRSGGDGSLSRTGNSLSLGASTSWEADIWGALRRGVESAQASSQASAADLAAARLSAQALLATDYFALRDADNEIVLLRQAVDAFQRAYTITQNRYDAAIAAKTDLLQAQTQLENTRASLVAEVAQRAQLEHAIAVLIGKQPAEFTLAPAPWNMAIPPLPLGVPSELLQRRPDIASAERAVAAANAQIGVQQAAYYPSLTLSGSAGNSATRVADLFKASSLAWSFGASAAATVFNAGATTARVDEATALRDAAAAKYRQTVLTAFQGVEDQLSTIRSLSDQAESRRAASAAADLTEQQLLNQYRAGIVAYTNVVTAQASALSARQTLSQLASNRQAAAIGLIQALGGGWHAPQ